VPIGAHGSIGAHIASLPRPILGRGNGSARVWPVPMKRGAAEECRGSDDSRLKLKLAFVF